MNIVTLINKLEKQKQNIEAALSVLRAETETPVTAKKVTENLKEGSWFYNKVKNPTKTGFKYNGKHWTQLKKNKKRLKKILKDAAKTKAAKS